MAAICTWKMECVSWMEISLSLSGYQQILGATVEWDAASSRILVVGSGTAIQSGDAFYPSEDLYWLSHIIYAESGTQLMEGKIAVGNVVLNRVNDPRFPNTVYGVVFQRNQFTPAMTVPLILAPVVPLVQGL